MLNDREIQPDEKLFLESLLEFNKIAKQSSDN
jgi:hypothetical protein